MTQLTKKQKKEVAKANKRIKLYLPTEIYLVINKGHRVLNKTLPGLAVDIWNRLNSLTKEELNTHILYIPSEIFTQYLDILNKAYFNNVPTKVRPNQMIVRIYNVEYAIKEDFLSKLERENSDQIIKKQDEQTNIQNKEEGAESSNVQGNT